mmetsp:Transcript_62268/g.190224  ORF Transcript_62268/g.190224 Transcript_62268/m.190224 type:complete len:222 (+) Transcript_62268:385-1050(+)
MQPPSSRARNPGVAEAGGAFLADVRRVRVRRPVGSARPIRPLQPPQEGHSWSARTLELGQATGVGRHHPRHAAGLHRAVHAGAHPHPGRDDRQRMEARFVLGRAGTVGTRDVFHGPRARPDLPVLRHLDVRPALHELPAALEIHPHGRPSGGTTVYADVGVRGHPGRLCLRCRGRASLNLRLRRDLFTGAAPVPHRRRKAADGCVGQRRRDLQLRDAVVHA